MKVRSILLLLLLTLCQLVQAQDFDNYQPIRCTGAIPESFTTSSTEKYNTAVQNIDKGEKKRIRKHKKKFYLESNFVIDELLLSGKVMYNDPVSSYLGKVMDKLLKDDHELRSKVEVYVIRTNAVNAFTTNNGIIFVTMGLLSRLKNESQLAFVLCHELMHYVKQHGLDEYVENQEIAAGRGVYRKATLEEKLLARSNYSKEKETEADLLGLELYLKSEYSLEAPNGAFTILQFSHLPYEDAAFRKTFLETPTIRFDDHFFLKKTKEIVADQHSDSLSTHPGIQKRKDAIADKLKGKSNEGKRLFIVSKTDFLNVQKLCRYETCLIALQNRDYQEALYQAYLLMQENTDSKYLKKIVIKSLYGLSKYANAGRYDEIAVNYENIQGSSQQLYYLIDQMNRKELNVLALAHAWEYHLKHPSDDEVSEIAQDLFNDLTEINYKSRTYFASTLPAGMDFEKASKEIMVKSDTLVLKDDPQDSTSEEPTAKPKAAKETKKTKAPTTAAKDKKEKDKVKSKEKDPLKRKYEKQNREAALKKKKSKSRKNSKSESPNTFTKYAFVNYLSDTTFTGCFNRGIARKKDMDKLAQKEKNREYQKKQLRHDAFITHHGEAFDVPKVVFVNPFYYKIDLTKKDPVRFTASESAQKKLNTRIKDNAEKAGLQYEIVDKKDLKEGNSDLFNDVADLNNYLDETFSHGDKMHFVNYKTKQMQDLIKKYNTQYFVWSGLISIKRPKEMDDYMQLIFAPLIYPAAPYIVYKTFAPHYETYFFSMLIDMNSGNKISTTLLKINMKDGSDVINSTLYDTYKQYHNQRTVSK